MFVSLVNQGRTVEIFTIDTFFLFLNLFLDSTYLKCYFSLPVEKKIFSIISAHRMQVVFCQYIIASFMLCMSGMVFAQPNDEAAKAQVVSQYTTIDELLLSWDE